MHVSWWVKTTPYTLSVSVAVSFIAKEIFQLLYMYWWTWSSASSKQSMKTYNVYQLAVLKGLICKKYRQCHSASQCIEGRACLVWVIDSLGAQNFQAKWPSAEISPCAAGHSNQSATIHQVPLSKCILCCVKKNSQQFLWPELNVFSRL